MSHSSRNSTLIFSAILLTFGCLFHLIHIIAGIALQHQFVLHYWHTKAFTALMILSIGSMSLILVICFLTTLPQLSQLAIMKKLKRWFSKCGCFVSDNTQMILLFVSLIVSVLFGGAPLIGECVLLGKLLNDLFVSESLVVFMIVLCCCQCLLVFLIPIDVGLKMKELFEKPDSEHVENNAHYEETSNFNTTDSQTFTEVPDSMNV
ncbi:hypothetical protein C9374_004662 [Naegleria lovaniensis]|uniref:Uncharacterized protein n=1 Tax=Naegleria lovaniensis TaxID=51637 RepID=A0AA88GSK2_NAELO|nr:uncharacterized protein C9374_004662 [Naegleria lovaniensis]KAG2383325.1 hypothetical protein C9374_004662 [Naegleria lovaniensis]